MNAVVASFIATIVELVSNKVGVDDNLSIPISFGIALSSFNNLSLI
jgi:dolichol kinase